VFNTVGKNIPDQKSKKKNVSHHLKIIWQKASQILSQYLKNLIL
jgi:hypothetical protein